MKLFDIYKKSYSDVLNNPNITFILVLFLIISGLFSAKMFTSTTMILAILFSFCTFLICLCFISGWSQILKTISQEKENEGKNYFPIFLEGVGKNIVPIGIAGLIYSSLLFIVFLITGKIAHSVFGSLDFLMKDLTIITQDNKALMEYFNNLTQEQQFTIYSWQLSFMLSSLIFNFLMLFYLPAIVFEKSENLLTKPFVSLKNALCFLFKNFFGALFIYINFYIIYAILAILKVHFSSNIIISILLLFFYIYFISTVIMLIFNYYEQRNNSDNGCNSIGENESINQISEEN